MKQGCLIAVALALVACSKGPEPRAAKAPEKPAPFSPTPPQREVHLMRPPIPRQEAFVGVWKSKDTSARMRITRSIEGLKLEAWDADDLEGFEVHEVKMVDEALHSDWRVPSTNHHTHAALRIKSANEIEEECTGCKGQGTISWQRDMDDALQQPPGGIVPLQNGWR